MDDDDFLYHVVTPSVHHSAHGFLSLAKPGEGIHQDFILLASKRRPCGSGSVLKKICWALPVVALGHLAGLQSAVFVITSDPYVIALRSVSLTSHPPAEGCNRGEVRCAGFTIQDTKNNTSLVKPTIPSMLKPLITLLKIHFLLIDLTFCEFVSR